MHQVYFAKRIVSELAMKLQGVVADWDGSKVNGRKYEALLAKVEAYERTIDQQLATSFDSLACDRAAQEPLALSLTAWECDACADELEDSAAALHDNGHKNVARVYKAKAAELRATAG